MPQPEYTPKPWINETTVFSNRDFYYVIFCRFSFCRWHVQAGPAQPPDFDRTHLEAEVQQMERDHVRISHPDYRPERS